MNTIQQLPTEALINNMMKAIPSGHKAIDTQGPIWMRFRKDGEKVATSLVEQYTSWEMGLKEGFDHMMGRVYQETKHWQTGSTIEVNLTYDWRRMQENQKFPPNIQRGLTGMYFSHENVDFMFPPTDIVARNLPFDKAQEFFEGLVEVAGGQKTPKGKSPSYERHLFRALQFLIVLKGDLQIYPLYRANRIVRPDDITRDTITALATGMASWMNNQVMEDGRLLYKYWPSNAKESRAVNLIRLFMGAHCFIKLYKHYRDENYLTQGKRVLRYLFDRFYKEENGLGFVDEYGKVKLGANALAALCIEDLPEHDAAEYAREASGIAKLVDHLWKNEDGSFKTFYKPEKRNDCQNFYPGEALLYWAHRYRKSKDPALYDKIQKSFEYYYHTYHQEKPNPAFIPWHTQAYYMLWQDTKEQAYVDAILQMNTWLLPIQQWEDQKYPDIKGRFHDIIRPFGPPHASSTGVYIEGLIDAYYLAHQVNDMAKKDLFGQAILRGIRSLRQLQFKDAVDMFYVTEGKRVEGGLRTTVYNNEIRVDNVQHGLMGLLKVMQSDLPEYARIEDL